MGNVAPSWHPRAPSLRRLHLTCKRLLAYYVCMFDPVDRVFKALADPGRRRLLDALRDENGQTLNQMCAHLDMSRQAVAQHLGVLESASLVVVVWHGREKLHYINPVPLFEVSERWIRSFERSRLAALQDLKLNLEERHDKT